MIRIRIFSDFCSSTECKKQFERTNVSSNVSTYGPTNKYYITDQDDYTHVILLNKAMPPLSRVCQKTCSTIFYWKRVWIASSFC
jgi:hypothetical protein